MLVRITNRESGMTMIRLHLQKQSNIGLHCLSRPLWQATSVRNFRTSTVYILKKAQIYACHSEVKISTIFDHKIIHLSLSCFEYSKELPHSDSSNETADNQVYLVTYSSAFFNVLHVGYFCMLFLFVIV